MIEFSRHRLGVGAPPRLPRRADTATHGRGSRRRGHASRPPSPSWHTRQRRLRAKARATLRHGLKPSSRLRAAAARLQRHHGSRLPSGMANDNRSGSRRPRSASVRRSSGESEVAWSHKSGSYIFYCNGERDGEVCKRSIPCNSMAPPAGRNSGYRCPCGKWATGPLLSKAGRDDLRGDNATSWSQQPRKDSWSGTKSGWGSGWDDSSWQSSDWHADQPGQSASAADHTSPPATSIRDTQAEALRSTGKNEEEIQEILDTLHPPAAVPEPEGEAADPSLVEKLAAANSKYREKLVASNQATARRTQVSKHITDLEARLGQAKDKFKEVTDQEAEALHNLKVSLDEQCGLQAQLVAAQHDGSIPAGLLPAATSTGLEGPLQRLATIDGIDAWAEQCEQAVKLGAGAIDVQVGQLREKLLSQHQTLLANATSGLWSEEAFAEGRYHEVEDEAMDTGEYDDETSSIDGPRGPRLGGEARPPSAPEGGSHG